MFDNYDMIDFLCIKCPVKRRSSWQNFSTGTNQTKTVVNELLRRKKHHTIILYNGDKIQSKTIIIAVGGKAVLPTGYLVDVVG